LKEFALCVKNHQPLAYDNSTKTSIKLSVSKKLLKPTHSGLQAQMTALLIICFLLLVIGCIKVGGKFRWVNRRTVSDIVCESTTQEQRLNISVFDYKSSPLPGASLILKRNDQSEEGEEIANSKGEATFSVGPSQWTLVITIEGFNTHEQRITILNQQSCTIRVYLGNVPQEPML
jgi:hypothetical protein